MKKRFAIVLLTIITAFSLTACGKFTCDMCGEEKSGRSYTVSVWGEQLTICGDCKAGMDEIKNMFN